MPTGFWRTIPEREPARQLSFLRKAAGTKIAHYANA